MDNRNTVSFRSATSALNEVDNLVSTSNFFRDGKEQIISTKKVMVLLKEEIQSGSVIINERLLRAMHDIGMSSYKEFENIPLEEAVCNLNSVLYDEIPYYKKLTPLRGDFGKGNPI